MKSYQVSFRKLAQKELERIPSPYQMHIFESIKALSQNPRPIGCKKLLGSTDVFRIRQGTYRVIYAIDEDLAQIEILRVAHRKDAYR